jgi:hypothetical protein
MITLSDFYSRLKPVQNLSRVLRYTNVRQLVVVIEVMDGLIESEVEEEVESENNGLCHKLLW